MGKRKVSRRQAWRIDRIQSERAARATRQDALVEAQLEGGELGPEQEGLIVAHFGRQVELEPLESGRGGACVRCHLRTHLGQLVTGDRVIWRRTPDGGVVVAALDRRSELLRPNNYGELKPVAANIDLIILVIAVEPHPHANLIDRYLVAAAASAIEPVLLLNKADLLDADNRRRLDPLLELYRSLGYRTLQASTASQHGLDQLRALLAGHTSAFVGQSGVGKSSLINSLLPAAALRVGVLSEQSRTGRHTTTTARLFHLPGGGDLIDSPGIREFGLWHMSQEQVLHGFRELAQLQGQCRFRDCRHEQEPGCAFRAAVVDGRVSEQRFNSYRQILDSMQNKR
jgi:ribosome biogenesis GTPase